MYKCILYILNVQDILYSLYVGCAAYIILFTGLKVWSTTKHEFNKRIYVEFYFGQV